MAKECVPWSLVPQTQSVARSELLIPQVTSQRSPSVFGSYALATSLNAQLDGLARSLSTMIDEVNNVTAPSSHRALKSADNTASLAASATQAGDGPDEADPMTQIQSILNAHLESLSWINDTVRELENKVVGLERKFGTAVPAQEERRAPAPLARGGGSHLYRSTMLEGDSPLPTSRRGYGLR